jgi:hypothetical protein
VGPDAQQARFLSLSTLYKSQLWRGAFLQSTMRPAEAFPGCPQMSVEKGEVPASPKSDLRGHAPLALHKLPSLDTTKLSRTQSRYATHSQRAA